MKFDYTIVGGLGYIGFLLCERLKLQNKGVKIRCVDIDYFLCNDNNLNLDALYDEYVKENVINIDVEKLYADKLIWCCDVDIERFYLTDIGEKYIQSMDKKYEEISTNPNFKEVYRLIDHSTKYTGKYGEYLKKNSKNLFGININTPLLFGFSDNMRFDTFINLYVLYLLSGEDLVVNSWWRNYNVGGIKRFITNVVDIIEKKKNVIEYSGATLITWISILKTLTDSQKRVIFEDVDLYEKLDEMNFGIYLVEDKVLSELKEFISEFKKGLENNRFNMEELHAIKYRRKDLYELATQFGDFISIVSGMKGIKNG